MCNKIFYFKFFELTCNSILDFETVKRLNLQVKKNAVWFFFDRDVITASYTKNFNHKVSSMFSESLSK